MQNKLEMEALDAIIKQTESNELKVILNAVCASLSSGRLTPLVYYIVPFVQKELKLMQAATNHN